MQTTSMSNIRHALCWMCGTRQTVREHVFQARDLKQIFSKTFFTRVAPFFHFSHDGHAQIQGPKSDRLKYPNIICRRCNNERTSAFDRAYDRLSDWFVSRQPDYDIAAMDLLEVFGPSYIEGVEDLRWFFAKNLGCRIVASRSMPADNFPNPFRCNNGELFQVSISVTAVS